MDIKELKIKYKSNTLYDVSLCRIGFQTPHFHTNEIELIFCLKGSVNLISGHEYQNLKIYEGEIFSIDYDDIHHMQSDEDNLVLIVHINLHNLEIPYDKLKHVFFTCESRHCYPHQVSAMADVKNIILAIAHVFFSEEHSTIPDEELRSKGNKLTNRLMLTLYKSFNWYSYEQHDDYLNDAFYERFYRILSFCSEHYKEKIRIEDIAQLEHIHPKYCSSFFGKTVFTKFGTIMNFIRSFEAEHLLLTTDMPIFEISSEVGFSDTKYMYSAFKHFYKCTPMEHRKKYEQYICHDENIEYIAASNALSIIEKEITKCHISWYLK